MTTFKPTVPPPGRLARLGVVLDTRNPPDRLREVAKMCDRAGIDALWVRDQAAPAGGAPRLDAWTALVLAGLATSRIRMGAMLDIAFRPPAMVVAMAATLDVALGGRLEIGVSGGASTARAARLEAYSTLLRTLLAGESTRGFPLSVAARGPLEIAVAARVADDVVLSATAFPELRATVQKVRMDARAAEQGASALQEA